MTLVASLCAGEFGWLVSAWIPWLRGKAQGQEMRALCAPGHEALFEDFATPVPIETPWKIGNRLCCHAWRESERKPISRQDYVALARENGAEGQVLTPYEIDLDLEHVPEGMWPLVVRGAKWRRYGDETARNLVVVHARNHDLSPERNWPAEKWAELRPYLPADVVAIGSREGALLPPACEDRRSVPSGDTIRILARARVVIGPSSGPLPLANLCGAPVVWWSPHRKDVRRFAEVWNPFGIQNVQAAASWTPSVQDVLSAYLSTENARDAA